MKTTTPSNWRALLRALSAFLIAVAALLAMPKNARAQVYVVRSADGVVSKYNPRTGATINASFIAGLD
jgi:hypothetical protein